MSAPIKMSLELSRLEAVIVLGSLQRLSDSYGQRPKLSPKESRNFDVALKVGKRLRASLDLAERVTFEVEG